MKENTMKQLIVFFLFALAFNGYAADSNSDEDSSDEDSPPDDFILVTSIIDPIMFENAYKLLYRKKPTAFLAHWRSPAHAHRELTQTLEHLSNQINNIDNTNDKYGEKAKKIKECIAACKLLLKFFRPAPQ